VLYDVTSTYVEGCCCPLAQFGHNHDGKTKKMHIVFGMLCAHDGCPIAACRWSGVGPPSGPVESSRRRRRLTLRRPR
jgi:hypothetical protein